MASNRTLKELASRFPECLPIHKDIKKAIPERDALKLLHAGFTDCSWRDDECASYFFDVVYADDVATICVVLDDEGVHYTISCTDWVWNIYRNIEEAIKAYKLKLIKEEA